MEKLIKIVNKLNVAVGGGVEVKKHIKLHNEDEWNEYEITYQGIIVGSELTANDYDYVLRNILLIKGE
jgi:hypothetical protein